MNMNRVLLAGNLTRDPVLRTVASGLPCVDFGLALNESFTGKDGKKRDKVCFLDVVVWDKQAKACADHLRKGAPLFLEGRLQYDEWEDKEGHKRNKIRVRADRVHFLGKPVEGAQRKAADREDGPPLDE
jgi:single-strand DNA-binding protein